MDTPPDPIEFSSDRDPTTHKVVEKGCLLVSRPVVGDPNFSRTVVYVIEHALGGTAGVVLNRPTDTPVGVVLEGWGELASDPRVVFVGGPVGQEAALCLVFAKPGAEPAGFERIDGQVGLIDLNADPVAAGPDVGALRIFLGYAGWGPGQLAAEIESEGWFVVDTQGLDIFTAEPEDLYWVVMRRQRGERALVSTFPDEPELN